MATVKDTALVLPDRLAEAARARAREQGLSLQDFVAAAVRDKLVATQAEFFSKRRGRGSLQRLAEILDREGGEEPRPDDLLPPGVERTYLTKKRPAKKA